ncbi:MAG TPA: hypothetical protein VMF11_01370 [Candidatus Baltobacteraceae bacterium]|nr:hypothetical protein [Candidatus Baltobacteraceae bacterium]
MRDGIRVLIVCVLAGLLAGCGGGGGSAPLLPAASTGGTGAPTGAATATPAPSTGGTASSTAQAHVITADYLGTPWGSTTVTPAQAAPYLNWAETGLANTNATAAAGIKTMVYMDVNRVQSNDPLYSQLSGSEYEQTCSGAPVTDFFDGVTQYVTNPTSSALRAAYKSYVASVTAGYSVDAIFEDDADPLSQDPSSGYFSSGPPCNYSDTDWIAGEIAMLAGLNVPQIVNGFSRMTSAEPISSTTRLLTNSSTIGGNMESCYVENSSPAEEGSWVWTGTEDTSLLVTNESKYFECWAMDYSSAGSAIPSRLYTLASFLMTYNPTYSILREMYATPSGLHVMPESQLVPTQPVVPQPGAVASLESGDVYVREYRACYYAGALIGQCAMVVNDDTSAHATPALTLSYSHTLVLNGAGILDGGTAAFNGAAPPSTLAGRSAFVALP